MNRRKKLIILILIVCIIGIFAFVGSFFLGGPSLASGDKNILVLASDKDEQPGGGVDMAYMVKLENGTIANYTPVYPGGMTHPTKQALGGLEGPMRLHDCLWDGPEQGMEYAKEIVEANTGMHADAVEIIYDDGLDANIDSIRPLKVDGVEMDLGATDIVNYHNEDVVETVLNLTNQEGVDSVIVAGGGDEVFTQAVDIVKYGIGTIGNINYYGGTGNLGFPKFSVVPVKEKKKIKTEQAKGGRRRIERLLSMVKYDRIHPQELVTHELMGLDSVEEALEMMRVKQPDLIKVMVVTDFEFARNWRKTNEKN